jgi:hypothetical protein
LERIFRGTADDRRTVVTKNHTKRPVTQPTQRLSKERKEALLSLSGNNPIVIAV